MKHAPKILLISALATTLFSCSAIKKTFFPEKVEQTDVIEGAAEGEEWKEVGPATETAYEIEPDSASINTYGFDMPESMATNTDSLLNSWQARNLLRKLDCDGNGRDKIVMTDTMYAKRLISIPSIVRMRYNKPVRSCIDRYLKNRSQVSYMLGISEFYMPMFEAEIDRLGLPHELKYLPVIESAMNPTAKSRVGAKGLWQFMFGTSKLYGLKSNNYIEDRYDPLKSTKAALAYLKELYTMFNSWELAIAAYNCGPGNVRKAITRSGGKTDFWKIYRWLPKETRGYLPAFIAANYIMTYYEDHGICPMEPNIPIATDTIQINRNLHFKQIVEVCGASLEELRALNPQYIKDIIPGENEAYTLRLTNDMVTKFIENEDKIYSYKADVYFPDRDIAKMLKEAKANNEGYSGKLVYHKIKKGETLNKIARKYKVTVKQIMKWNKMRNTKIRVGKTLKIYR